MKSEERNSAPDDRDDFVVRGLDSEIIERLRIAIRDAGGNKAVSEKSGVALSTLNGALAGKNQPRASAMAAIAAATGRSLDWLMMLSDSPSRSPAPEAAMEDLVHVERLAFAGSAGSGSLVIEEAADSVPVATALLQRLHLRPEHARVLDAVGNSMVPTIRDGDPLIVDVSPDARSRIADDAIYAFTIGEEAFIKRLRREPGQLMMVSDNAESFPTRPVPAGEPFRIIGRICWVSHQL